MLDTSRNYQANRGRIALAVSQFAVPMLSLIYRQFDGDCVAAIVLGEIGHRNVEGWLNRRENPEAALADEEQRRQVMRPCNALSISEACGIPRETVRRKVVQLIDMGFIARDDAGHLYLTTNLSARFAAPTARLVEELLATARRVETLLADDAPGSGAQQVADTGPFPVRDLPLCAQMRGPAS